MSVRVVDVDEWSDPDGNGERRRAELPATSPPGSDFREFRHSEVWTLTTTS